MNNFLVVLEQNDDIIQYLVSADDINYTTNAVCLMVEWKTVAYFRRDNVISITQYEHKINFIKEET